MIAAALYVLSVEYDKLEEKDRAKDQEGVRKWIIKHRGGAVAKLAGKVEPPFSESSRVILGEADQLAAFTIDQMLKDVGAMMEELLVKTLVPPATQTAKK